MLTQILHLIMLDILEKPLFNTFQSKYDAMQSFNSFINLLLYYWSRGCTHLDEYFSQGILTLELSKSLRQ